MVVVQPDVELMLGQIGRVLGHQLRIVVLGLAEEDPADMGPPGAVARGVRIARLIGFLVMDPVGGHPEDRAALQGQGSTDREKVLQQERHLVGPVRMQAMLSQADSHARCQPQQNQGGDQIVPVEQKHGRHSSHVQKSQDNHNHPVQGPGFGDINDFSGHGILGARTFCPFTLARFRHAVCKSYVIFSGNLGGVYGRK